MRPLSKTSKNAIDTDPFYRTCSRAWDGECDGRITIEHVFMYAGNQIDDAWNLIPICERHHSVLSHQDGGLLDKSINEWIALNRADLSILTEKYPRFVWLQRYNYLEEKYG